MNHFKSLKAFTILEVLLTLMLMGIIITISYTLFNVLGKQLSLFEKENVSELDYNLFNYAIQNDMDKAEDFDIHSDALSLHYYDNTTIHYTISNNTILRNRATSTDTFKVHVVDFKFSPHDSNKPWNKTFELSLVVLNDTIHANYFLERSLIKNINSLYLNEN